MKTNDPDPDEEAADDIMHRKSKGICAAERYHPPAVLYALSRLRIELQEEPAQVLSDIRYRIAES
jgi:hypothetical protein